MSRVKIQTGLKLLNLIKKSKNIEFGYISVRFDYPVYDLDKKSSKYDVIPDNANSMEVPSVFGQTTLVINMKSKNGNGC